MRKSVKWIVFVVAISILMCVAALSSSADNYAFSVYDKDGKIVSSLCGNTEENLVSNANLLSDGDTIVFNKNFKITQCIAFESTAENPRNINIDLNGNMLYSLVKINMICAGKNTTVNVYSSRAGGEIYVTKADDPVYGGNIFFLKDQNSAMNVGTVTVNGVTYPGSNISTYSTALVDVGQNATMCEGSVFNLDGGNYYSIQSDYSGFIIPRCGDVVMNIKNANIITLETRAPINAAGYSTVLNLENCLIVNYESTPVKLFNNANGNVNMKNCITTYSIAASSYIPGVLKLEGENIFSKSAGFEPEILEAEGLILGNTYVEYEMIGGGRTYKCYSANGNLSPMTTTLPDLKEMNKFIPEEDAVEYTFVYDGTSTSQYWSKYDEVSFPIETPTDSQEGVYRYAWLKTYDENGAIIYTLEKVGEFNIKVSLCYEEDALSFYVYAPESLVKEGVLDFAGVTIDDIKYSRFDWEQIEVDGEKYYRTRTPEISQEDINKKIEVYIPCDFGKNIVTKSIWYISLEEYVNKVLETESEGKYSKTDYDFVRNIQQQFLTKEEPVAILYKKENI